MSKKTNVRTRNRQQRKKRPLFGWLLPRLRKRRSSKVIALQVADEAVRLERLMRFKEAQSSNQDPLF